MAEEESSSDDEDYQPEAGETEASASATTNPTVVTRSSLRNGFIAESIAKGSENPVETVEEKCRIDAIWADFQGGKKPKKISSEVDVSSTATATIVASSTQPQVKPAETADEKVSEDSIGEVTVAATNSLSTEVEQPTCQPSASHSDDKQTDNNTKLPPPRKRVGAALAGFLDQIGKKSKLNTLEKSKSEWENFKATEGIQEELKTFNRGREGFLERQEFLQRTDHRQFEKERNLRNISRKPL